MNKRLLSFVSMIACLCFVFTFSYTPVKASTSATELGAEEIEVFAYYMEGWIDRWFMGESSALDEYNQGYTGIEFRYDVEDSVYKGVLESVGSFEEYGNVTGTQSGDIITIKKSVVCSDRDAEFIFVYDTVNSVVDWYVETESTTAELVKKAGLNTLLGMGTVFVVLIFISFVISLFKFLSIGKKKEKSVVSSIPVEENAPVQAVTANVSNSDDEIAAVISAAIAAYEAEMEGTGMEVPADGLFVRSIRKRGFAN